MGEVIAFGLLSLVAVGGALCVVLPPFGRNPLHAALALLVSFFALAGVFVLLSAHLVAVLQVLVYAGAVMVLFLFVVMMLNLRPQDLAGGRPTVWKAVGAVAALALVAKLVAAVVVSLSVYPVIDLTEAGADTYGSARDVAGDLLMTYLLPFELASVLLLVAIVGAIAVARRRDPAGPSAAGEGGAP